jgi:hypothetical protein
VLDTGRLLTFALRALVLLLLVPLVWITVADGYNDAIAAPVRVLLPDDLSVKAVGRHILIQGQGGGAPVSIDGFTLHYGLILLAVLVLAAVDIGFLPRIAWLLSLAAGAYLTHVIGLTLLSLGVSWASTAASNGNPGGLVYSLFAVFWGLLPPIVGGAWAVWYWLPRLSKSSGQASSVS